MRVAFLLGLLAFGLALAAPAAAQPSAENKAQARAAFARAVAAEEKKDWRTAVDEYLAAYGHAPHPDVLFNVAVVYEKLGEHRQAADYYRRYLADAPAAPDRAKVERTIEQLRKKPSKVTVESQPAGAVIVVDGERLGRAPIELTLAAGQHQLVAEHGGAAARRQLGVEYGEPAVVMLVVGGQGHLVVASNEPGATVRVSGVPVGVTPWQGPLAPGRHVVIVEKAGFVPVERVVDVPPDGTAQVTASMVRPLGTIPPAAPRRNLGLLAGFGGGRPLFEGGESLFELTFGWRSSSNRADAFTGFAFGSGGVGYALGARLYLATRRVRPYLGGAAGLISSNSHARATAGLMLADLGSGRTAWDVHVEAGVITAVTDTSERSSGAFILAGFLWHLRQDPPMPAPLPPATR